MTLLILVGAAAGISAVHAQALSPQRAAQTGGDSLRPADTAKALASASPRARVGSTDADTVRLEVSEIVRLALQNSRTIENAALDRRADRYDRRVATDKFVPDLTLRSDATTGTRFSRNDPHPRIDRRNGTVNTDLTLSTLLPTGTRLRLGYEGVGGRTTTDLPSGVSVPDTVSTRSIDYQQTVEARVEQPLLQGFGADVNRASVRIARLQDASSRLDLKETLIGTVTQTVLAYRRYVEAREQRAIARSSLKRARRLLARNKRLVEAGRMAKLDLVQSRTQVSRQKLRLEQTRNRVNTSRLNLFQLLDVDRDLVIRPADSLTAPTVSLDVDSLVTLALKQRPDYQRAKNDVQIAKEDRTLATHNRLWDVRLVGSYSRNLRNDNLNLPYRGDPFSVQGGWNVGLTVERTLGNPRRERRLEQSRLQSQIADNRLKDLRQEIRLSVRSQVGTVRQRRRELRLARRVRRQSARKLAVEEQKLQKGRSSSFQVVSFQNDLIRARQSEVQAIIDYLNALTRLDRITGSTLRTWNVKVENFNRIEDL